MTIKKPSIHFDDTPPPITQSTPINELLPPVHKSLLITDELAASYNRTPMAILQALRLQAARSGFVLRTQRRNIQQHNEAGLRVWTAED